MVIGRNLTEEKTEDQHFPLWFMNHNRDAFYEVASILPPCL